LVPVTPPIPAPPLDVEVVPGVVGFVAGGAVLLVGAVLVDEVELLVVVVLVLVVGLVLVVVLVVFEVLVLLQSLAASSATVLAPWLRFCERVVLMVEGRLVTALVRAAEALLAWPQWWADTAAAIEFSGVVRLLFWSAESRPLLLPQATANAAANPRPPARNAREPKPIRRLTLAWIPDPGVV
jgi:hypothetical protein